MHGELVTLCGNHAAVLGHGPLSLDELRAEIAPTLDRRRGERRRGVERRAEPRETGDRRRTVA
jgi:hypothetical protein